MYHRHSSVVVCAYIAIGARLFDDSTVLDMHLNRALHIYVYWPIAALREKSKCVIIKDKCSHTMYYWHVKCVPISFRYTVCRTGLYEKVPRQHVRIYDLFTTERRRTLNNGLKFTTRFSSQLFHHHITYRSIVVQQHRVWWCMCRVRADSNLRVVTI